MEPPSSKRRRLSAGQSPVRQAPTNQALVYQAPLPQAPICLFPTDQVAVYQAPPPDSVYDALSYLDGPEILQIVYTLLSHPDSRTLVLSLINGTYNAKRAAEQEEVVDFDHFSKSVWYSLNRKWTDPRGSKEYENAWHAYGEVTDAIQSIRGSSKSHTSFGTRESALVTLRKIGKSVILARDVLGAEVRKNFQCDDCFVSAMFSIAENMSPEDRQNIRNLDGGEFVDKLEELVGLAKGKCIWEDLHEVLDVLLDRAPPREDRTDDSEDDEEEDSDDGSVEEGWGSR
ncbi:MAG: hypothetical protein M1820_009106 [Bogoriella megaspora]|nr:MAG: hypothetical protein M1820_009106 [Bogoriella megaspora]